MLELSNRNSKIVILVFYVFKMLCTDLEDIKKKTLVKFVEIQKTPDGINGRRKD